MTFKPITLTMPLLFFILILIGVLRRIYVKCTGGDKLADGHDRPKAGPNPSNGPETTKDVDVELGFNKSKVENNEGEGNKQITN
ncbi:hypothetical protein CASFOL_020892 [Castilleja foliolosa]|uniref:Uncharacterized protein n=1 Tax=Castilleja foliolosa TaxID=1961234 RepID=A0ABD3D255_9LAMI